MSVGWVAAAVAAWVLLAALTAVLLGRAIHLADEREGDPPRRPPDPTARSRPRQQVRPDVPTAHPCE